jgi:hypothetical protein
MEYFKNLEDGHKKKNKKFMVRPIYFPLHLVSKGIE